MEQLTFMTFSEVLASSLAHEMRNIRKWNEIYKTFYCRNLRKSWKISYHNGLLRKKLTELVP